MAGGEQTKVSFMKTWKVQLQLPHSRQGEKRSAEA